jgi:high-affinity nickel-transport protein
MCLLDTTDGALMFSLYIQPSANFLPPKPNISDEELPQAQSNHRDPIAFLYYSIVLTSLTVVVAIVIGVIQLLTMILNVTHAKGKFWDGVQTAGDYYDIIGGSICGCFIIFGGLSVLLYKPWRRWMTRRHGRSAATDEDGYRDNAPGGGEQGCAVFAKSIERQQQAPTETVGKGNFSQVAVMPTGEPRLEDEVV